MAHRVRCPLEQGVLGAVTPWVPTGITWKQNFSPRRLPCNGRITTSSPLRSSSATVGGGNRDSWEPCRLGSLLGEGLVTQGGLVGGRERGGRPAAAGETHCAQHHAQSSTSAPLPSHPHRPTPYWEEGRLAQGRGIWLLGGYPTPYPQRVLFCMPVQCPSPQPLSSHQPLTTAGCPQGTAFFPAHPSTWLEAGKQVIPVTVCRWRRWGIRLGHHPTLPLLESLPQQPLGEEPELMRPLLTATRRTWGEGLAPRREAGGRRLEGVNAQLWGTSDPECPSSGYWSAGVSVAPGMGVSQEAGLCP